MAHLTVNDCFYQIRNGANIKQGDADGGYPITRIETISNDVFNRDRMGYAGITDLTKYESYVLEDGDLLMSHINSVQYLGRTVLYEKQGDEKIIHGMNLLGLKANRSIVKPAFARYAFYSPKFRQQLRRITKKSVNQASFTVADLKKIEIDVPSLEKQAHIVENLDKTKRILALRRQEIEVLDALIKARFVEMFGDLADPACKWEKCKLVDVCVNSDDIKCGPFGTQLGKDEYTEEGVAVWEIPQINSEFRTLPTHFVTEKKAEELDAYSIIPGDIAMSRKGNVGRCAVFPSSFENGIIHSDVLRIRLNEMKALPEFMMRQLHYSGDIQHQIELVSSGAIMAGINVTKLKQILIYLPPMNLQSEFVEFVAQVDKSKVAVQAALDKAQLLFDSLMQEYFG